MSAPVGPLWTQATSPSVNALVATLPALIFSILGLLTMIGFTIIVEGKKVENQHMLMLAEKIHKGAVDFLKTEYKFLAVFVLAIFVAVTCMLIPAQNKSNGASYGTFGLWSGIPLLIGASLSAYAGWRGMVIATKANVRTTAACDPAAGGSINEGLRVAFKSG